MIKNLSVKSIGILLTLIAFSFTSLGDVSTKALTAYFNVFAVGYYLNLFTIAFLIPIILFKGGFKKAFQTHSLKFHVLRSLFMTGVFITIIYAFGVLPLTKTYIIIYTAPFILNILAMIIIKEKISFSRWLAILFAFIGVLVALRPGIIPLNTGTFAAFGTAIFLACATITVKYIDSRDKWLPYICYPMAIQTPILGVLTYVQGESLLPPNISTPWIFLLMGGLAFVIGLSLLPQAIKRIDASIFGALIYISFPWGVFYGYFFFKDVPDLWTIIGAVIIIASGLFLIYRERKEHSKLLELETEQNGTRTR